MVVNSNPKRSLTKARNQEVLYLILKLVESRSDMNQRMVATTLGISLGKVNFHIKHMMKLGWIKRESWSSGKNKVNYYQLTIEGKRSKTMLAAASLAFKKEQLDLLKGEIIALHNELSCGYPI